MELDRHVDAAFAVAEVYITVGCRCSESELVLVVGSFKILGTYAIENTRGRPLACYICAKQSVGVLAKGKGHSSSREFVVPRGKSKRGFVRVCRSRFRRAHMMETGTILSFFGVLLAFFAVIVALGSFFTVETAQVAIVQRLGKFARVAGPGLNWKTPLIETVVRRMSMKVQQFDVQVETKTQDNVFVQIPVSIQYKVMPEAVEAAFYKLTDPVKQIESMVYNVVLGHVPKMKLDDTFLNQADIANDLRDNLDASMKEYGYSIVKVLISDIVPDQKVKAAMNDINAAQREREATVSRAETNKMLLVKQAEAEAESKRLQGEGIANQRKAIIAGLKDSVEDFAKTVPGSTPQDVMQLVLMTQYFDTLKEIAANDHTNAILIPHTPNTLTDLFGQIRNAIVAGNELASHSAIPPTPTAFPSTKP